MKRLILLVTIFIGGLFILIQNKTTTNGALFNSDIPLSFNNSQAKTPKELWDEQQRNKRERRKNGYSKMDAPDKLQEYHAQIRTRSGASGPDYPINYRINALRNIPRLNLRTSSTVIEYLNRGPNNVPGRTRGLLNLPGDANDETWMAGSAGGGIWKTTTGGQSWTLLTPDFPTLAVSTLAMSEVDDNVIYAGTGEYIASSGTAIEGQGIFKTTDGGITWVQLPSTVGTLDFLNITRIIVDPSNPNIVLACSAPNNWRRGSDEFISTIMRSTDGGDTWTKTFEVDLQDLQNGDATGAIEQLIFTPGNFNVMFASMNGSGPYKSLDGGITWEPSFEGMGAFGRVELGISPVNTNIMFASAQGALSGADSDSDLYFSENAGESWAFLRTEFNGVPVDFLGGQGWYDNTVACDLYDPNVVYVGGVSLFRFEVSEEFRNSYRFENNTDFVQFVNFGADYASGTLEAGEFAGEFSIEVRFGPDRSQLAHRYTVPEGATSGVPPDQYFYQDYVSVPFEVWDITNNRQLMVGFRDQDRNSEFNLYPRNTSGQATSHSREYLYLADIPYAETPAENMALTGGHEFRNIFFVWPVLNDTATWDPSNLPESNFSILYNGQERAGATTTTVADVYGEFDGNNQFTAFGEVHPDQHNMIMIPVNNTEQTYKILLSNDGGVFVSDPAIEPGVADGSWNFAGLGYITTQFYGAEKMPGQERFLGGSQDNGTWFSPENTSASDATNYLFAIGGDGFEVLWNAIDGNKFIGGSQFNRFAVTIDGGDTFFNAREGLSGDSPFISKLANTDAWPDRIFTVTSEGVFTSYDFGFRWTPTPIEERWIRNGNVTFLDVEVSRANGNIIWAGSGMDSARSLHYSTDGGRTFNIANNYSEEMGVFTKLGTHPTEPETAYALFSFSKAPKVLRTRDLGQTWEDISGFGDGDQSTNGFPDVAVYTIYVRPEDPNIIWVGTEIGIVESLDNGVTWHLLDEFPNASVWQMNGRDNFITIATHGLGIWTAEVEEIQNMYVRPEIDTMARMPNGNVLMAFDNKFDYDSAAFYINGFYVGSLEGLEVGKDTVQISGLEINDFEISMIGYTADGPVANNYVADLSPITDPISEFTAFFRVPESTFTSQTFIREILNPSGKNVSYNSPHPYPTNADLIFNFASPLVVSEINPIISYRDIAIVEPGEGNDYVVVEGSQDGLNWLEVTERYDAGISNNWTEIYNSNGTPTNDDFLEQQADLSTAFSAGDTIYVRFRLHSDAQNTGWGWAVDDFFVQTRVVSVDKDNEARVVLYPNPANDQIAIRFKANVNERNVSIADINGRILYNRKISTPEKNINVSGFKNGVYFLYIDEKGRREVHKFVVRH